MLSRPCRLKTSLGRYTNTTRVQQATKDFTYVTLWKLEFLKVEQTVSTENLARQHLQVVPGHVQHLQQGKYFFLSWIWCECFFFAHMPTNMSSNITKKNIKIKIKCNISLCKVNNHNGSIKLFIMQCRFRQVNIWDRAEKNTKKNRKKHQWPLLSFIAFAWTIFAITIT